MRKKTDITVSVNRSNNVGRFENTHDAKKYIAVHQLDEIEVSNGSCMNELSKGEEKVIIKDVEDKI